MSRQDFAKKVKIYLKAGGFSQKVLANAMDLNASVLNHKLNGNARFILTYPEIRDIVVTLAKLEAITRKPEALELLKLVDCPGFSTEEWHSYPLKNLEDITLPNPGEYR